MLLYLPEPRLVEKPAEPHRRLVSADEGDALVTRRRRRGLVRRPEVPVEDVELRLGRRFLGGLRRKQHPAGSELADDGADRLLRLRRKERDDLVLGHVPVPGEIEDGADDLVGVRAVDSRCRISAFQRERVVADDSLHRYRAQPCTGRCVLRLPPHLPDGESRAAAATAGAAG